MGNCDEELVIGLKNNDNEAFEELYYKYKNLLYFIIKRFSKSGYDAEDLLQEVFMKIHANIDGYNNSFASFKTWLAIIAKNHALDYTKKKNYIVYNDDIVYNAVDESTVIKPTKIDFVQESLSKLEFDFITLKICFNFSHKELAQLYDMSVDISKKFLTKTKNKVREEWKKYEDEIQ